MERVGDDSLPYSNDKTWKRDDPGVKFYIWNRVQSFDRIQRIIDKTTSAKKKNNK